MDGPRAPAVRRIGVAPLEPQKLRDHLQTGSSRFLTAPLLRGHILAMSRFRRLIREIHRRSLWQVLGIYLAAAWIALEVTSTLTESFDLPGWFPAFALGLLVLGLPIVLATAFVQEGMGPSDSEETWADDAPTRRDGEASWFTWRNALVGGVGAFALWGVMAAGWLVLGGRGPGEGPGIGEGGAADAAVAGTGSRVRPAPFKASVAVLPFENLGGSEDEFLSDGITDQIIAQLSAIEGLKVISRTSVVALKNTSLTSPQIGDTLGVDHLLEGTVQRFEDDVRVRVQFIEAAGDAHLWARTFTRTLDNVFDLQDEIAGEVSRSLVSSVDALGRTGPRQGPGASSPAYAAYLRGTYWLHRRTGEGLSRALEEFDAALDEDPRFAPAHAGRAAALGLWMTYLHPGGPPPYDAYAGAVAAAERAIELDPELAEGYSARAYSMTKIGGPSEEIVGDFESALRLRPNSADVHGWYGHILIRLERFDEGLAEARRAIELDPLAPGRRNGFAVDALGARRYGVAIREADQALLLAPELAYPRVVKAMALLLQGRADACLEVDLENRRGIHAACLHELGRVDEARAVADSLEGVLEGRPEGRHPLADLATIEDLSMYYAWTGAADPALQWLRRAFEHSPNGLDFRFYASGVFDRVRRESGFEEEVAELRAEAWRKVRAMADEMRDS